MRRINAAPSPEILILFVTVVIDIVEGFLGLRLLLKLFGASTDAPFVRWLYETTDPLIAPFSGMFPSPQLTSGLNIEFTSLFAMVFYIFVGYVITEVLHSLIYLASRRIPQED
jgi:hypothetical protein